MSEVTQFLKQFRRVTFDAAAESVRRSIVDAARRKARVKQGGEFQGVDLEAAVHPTNVCDAQVLAVNDLLDELTEQDAGAAEVVKLRYFAGYTFEDAADLLGTSGR